MAKEKIFPSPFSVCGFGNVQGICGANCRHSYGPSDGEFNPYEKIDTEENKRAYDLSQEQRGYERKIRDTKRKTLAIKEGRDAADDKAIKDALDLDYQKSAAKLQEQNKAYKEFCEKNGLKTRAERTQIAKWDREQAAQARGAATRWKNRTDEIGEKKLLKKLEKSDTIVPDVVVKSPKLQVVESEKEIADLFGLKETDVTLGDIHVRSAEAMKNGAKRVLEKFPELRGHTEKIRYQEEMDAWASSKSIPGIVTVGDKLKDPDDVLKRIRFGVKNGVHTKGSDRLESIMVHELGHQLDGYLTKKGVYGGNVLTGTRTGKQIKTEVLNRLGFTNERTNEIRQWWQSQGKTGKDLNEAVAWERREFIAKKVSSYAAERENEFFSELFTEYIMSDEPREAAKIFGEILEKIMEEIR